MPKPQTAELRAKNLEYAGASAPCDIVLKGGAASGFVYSGVALALAKKYRLQSIAGTSAGAGAAGVFAAAEYGRRSGNPDAWGFAGIEHVPEWAAERTANGWTRLKHLFGPDPETARLYEVVSAPFTASKGGGMKAVLAALKGYWLGTLGGFAIAAAIAGWLCWSLAPSLWPAIGIVGLALSAGVLLALLFVGIAVWKDATVVLAENHFGLCSARSEPSDSVDAPPDKMTGWLYGLYQHLAGKPMGDPLTFGDLWNAPRREGERGIGLSLMTVNLSLGRPVRITHDDEHEALEEDEAYWFDPADLRRLFPRDVVIAMEKAAGADPDGGETSRRLPFPPMAKVPVIVGVRMSFALPVLFSAVRLYKRDGTRLPVEHAEGKPLPESALEPCWFADGGVCTSLPIHLFDKPMPRWPTFAVNLRRTHPDSKGADGGPLRVWMDNEFSTSPADGWLREWWKRIDVDAVAGNPTRFKPVAPATQVKRLLGSMFATAIGWVDGAHLRLATCRDRVAHVCLDEAEGAFNVDTDPAAIRRLAQYGQRAGAKLVARFAAADAGGWTEHRAIRYIAAMQLAARFIDDFESGFKSGRTAAADERAIDGALSRAGFIKPPAAYGLNEAQLETMAKLTQALLDQEAFVPEPGKPGWPDHPALRPRFVARMMPDA